MPVILTDDNSVFPDVTSPIQSDGVSAVDIRAGLQSVADRTAWLKNQRGNNNGVAPLDASAVVPIINLPISSPNGLVRGDSSSPCRIPAASTRNGIISNTMAQFTSGPSSAYATTTSTTYVDVGSALLAVTGAAVGDSLRIALSFRFVAGAAGGFSRLVVVDGATTNALQEFGHGNAADTIVSMVWTFTVTTAGTQTIKPQYRANGSGTQSAYSVSIGATLIRP